MKKQHKFICLSFCICILYLFLSQSLVFNKTVETKNEAQKTVKLNKLRKSHLTISNINSSKLTYTTNNKPVDECSSFVSASCSAKSTKSKFNKLPERFARVSFLKSFIFCLSLKY